MMKPVTVLLYAKNLFILSAVLVLLCSCSAPPADHTPDPTVFTKSAAEVTWNIITDPLLLDNEAPSAEILSVLFGAQIAVDEINASGGINGSLIAFCVTDTASDFCLSCTDNAVECRTVQDNLLLFCITDTSSTSQETASFRSLHTNFPDIYQKMYANEPNFYATASYDCLYILKDMLEQDDVPTGTELLSHK